MNKSEPITMLDDSKDYSILDIPSNIERKQLFIMATQRNLKYESHISTKHLEGKIQRHMKLNHPINTFVKSMTNEKLRDLRDYIFGQDMEYTKRRRTLLIDTLRYYFKNHSKAPLTQLIRDISDMKPRTKKKKVKGLVATLQYDEDDPSVVLPNNLSIPMLKNELERHNVQVSVRWDDPTSARRDRLTRHLENHFKKIHPIHTIIESLNRTETKALIVFGGHKHISGCDSKVKRLLTKLCFEKQPTSPLAYLRSLQKAYRNNTSVCDLDKLSSEVLIKEEESTFEEDPLSAPSLPTHCICDDCGKTYKSKDSLRFHKRRLHSDKDISRL